MLLLTMCLVVFGEQSWAQEQAWRDIGSGIQASGLTRVHAQPRDVTMSTNAKRYYQRLAEIAKANKPPQYPDHHPEEAAAGGWGGTPSGYGPNSFRPRTFSLGPIGAVAGAPSMAPLTGARPSASVQGAKVGVTAGGMQDIGLARKMIRESEIPYPAAFTVEGLLSEHDISLGAVPDERALLYPTAAVAYVKRYGQQSPEAIVQIGFGAELPQGRFERPALNLAVVVDCSGSMNGTKIAAAKTALRKILDQLTDKDRVALVCFDNTVWVPLVSSPVNGETRRVFNAAIDKEVGAWGGTDIESGLKASFEQVAAHLSTAKQSKQHSRVLLVTDAQPNVNATGPDGFLTLLEAAAEHGIGVTAFGVGLDFGQDLAYRITQVPGASYHFLEDDTKLAKVFDKEFPYVVTPVAYGVDLVLRPMAGSVVTDALGIPDFQRLETVRDPQIRLKIPTLFFSARSGGGATAVTLTVPSGYLPGEHWLAEVSLAYQTSELYEPEGRRMDYRQGLRVMLPSEVDLRSDDPYFSSEGVRKALLLSDLTGALKAATEGVMVLQPWQSFWHPSAAARNIGLGLLPPPPGGWPVVPAQRHSRITPDRAKAGYQGLSEFLKEFAQVVGNVAGLEPELQMAEALERLLKQEVNAGRPIGERLWYGSRATDDEVELFVPDVPKSDPAFASRVDLSDIWRALARFDASALVDATLELNQAEQTLGRSHASGLTADRLFTAALETSMLTSDTASLQRLFEASEKLNKPQWLARARAARALGQESRSDTTPTMDVATLSVESVAKFRDLLHRLLQSQLLRDTKRTEALALEVSGDEVMTIEQREILQRRVEDSRDSADVQLTTGDATLQSLVRRSRSPLPGSLRTLAERCNALFGGADGDLVVRHEEDAAKGELIRAEFSLPLRFLERSPDLYEERHVSRRTVIDRDGRTHTESLDVITRLRTDALDNNRVLLTETIIGDDGTEGEPFTCEIIPLADEQGVRTQLRPEDAAKAEKGNWLSCDWTRTETGLLKGVRQYKDSDKVVTWWQQASNELDRVYRFLESHVIDRTLECQIITKITGDQVEAEFQRRAKYVNLVRTPIAVRFDAIVLIKQQNYDLDKDGQRLDKPPYIKDRSSVIRYTVRTAQSTGKLIGTSALVTSSMKEIVEGSGEALQVSLEGDRLTMVGSTPLYDDYFAPGGKYKPGAGRTTNEFHVQDGKLRLRSHELGFDVNPETLIRTPNGDNIVLESRETAGLF
jgi:Ca-activated chloride channel family protein